MASELHRVRWLKEACEARRDGTPRVCRAGMHRDEAQLPVHDSPQRPHAAERSGARAVRVTETGVRVEVGQGSR